MTNIIEYFFQVIIDYFCDVIVRDFASFENSHYN